MSRTRIRGAILFLMAVMGGAVGRAQETLATKALEFDVVSIRPSSLPPGSYDWGMNQSGNLYHTANAPMVRVILDAYFTKRNEKATYRVKGAPAWAMTDGYYIKAKVDDATAGAWKNLGPERTSVLVAPLLKKMLQERCKLTTHMDTMEVQGYALVVGKDGPKLKEATPGEKLPDNMRDVYPGGKILLAPPNGTTRIATFQMTMAQFVDYFSGDGATLVDQTGLTGLYDFNISLAPIDSLSAVAPGGDPWQLDPIERLRLWNLKAVGLEWKAVKLTVQTVVVDHIERPTEN